MIIVKNYTLVSYIMYLYFFYINALIILQVACHFCYAIFWLIFCIMPFSVYYLSSQFNSALSLILKEWQSGLQHVLWSRPSIIHDYSPLSHINIPSLSKRKLSDLYESCKMVCFGIQIYNRQRKCCWYVVMSCFL